MSTFHVTPPRAMLFGTWMANVMCAVMHRPVGLEEPRWLRPQRICHSTLACVCQHTCATMVRATAHIQPSVRCPHCGGQYKVVISWMLLWSCTLLPVMGDAGSRKRLVPLPHHCSRLHDPARRHVGCTAPVAWVVCLLPGQQPRIGTEIISHHDVAWMEQGARRHVRHV